MSIAKTTAAPSTVTLNGKEYKISPLKDVDWGELENWVKDSLIAFAERSTKNLPETQQMELIKHAYDKAAFLTVDSPEVIRRLASIDGVCMLILLSLRPHYPEMTLESVKELLASSNADVGNVVDRFNAINSIKILAEPKKKVYPRKVKRKKKRK